MYMTMRQYKHSEGSWKLRKDSSFGQPSVVMHYLKVAEEEELIRYQASFSLCYPLFPTHTSTGNGSATQLAQYYSTHDKSGL